MELLSAHYAAEQPFLEKLGPFEPRLAAKIAAQHEEVLEIAGHLEDALARNQEGDTLRLVRRLQAMAQHNIIEEERDVFPVAARCFEF